MKNYFLGIITLLFISCSTESNNSNIENNSLMNKGVENELSDEIKEKLKISAFYQIEKSNIEYINLVNELVAKNIDTTNLDFDKVTLMSFSNHDVKLISIPIKNSNEKILSYNFDKEYVFLKSLMIENQVTIFTLDNNKLAESKYENNTLLVNGVYDNSLVNNFSNAVYSKTDIGEAIDDGGGSSCCRKRTYTNCVRCTVDAIYGNSFWLMAGTYILPELTAAIFASCIGSGPNSFC